MFNPNMFWAAFGRAGMLVKASFQPAAGPAVEFDAGFNRPDQLLLDGVVHSTDYSIEYQAADVTLKRDDIVSITGEGQFRVRQAPRAKGDGSFVVAALEEVAT